MADQDKSKDQLIAEVLDLRRKAAALEESLDSTQSDDNQHAYNALKMEAIGRLAGGIAHDFNNILTAIQGNAELLQMDGFDQSERDDMLMQILAASRRATGLTRQLLDFARKGTFQIVAVDTTTIIEQTAALLSHSIDKRIDIKLDIQADPPAILADPSQIENALVNLGMNACDAMPDGGVLTLATRNIVLDDASCVDYPSEVVPGPYVEICVCDTGSGMDSKTRSRIFEPFFTTKDVGQGTGLGLASVYGCIKSHYGNIQVDSHPGRGTTFRLLLHAAETACASSDGAHDQSIMRGTGHVLVVDDEGIVREFLATALQKFGYSVSLCINGAEAVEYFKNSHRDIDLVILDLIMPVLNGPDTFRELKAIDPDVKVLISSGFSRNQSTNGLLDEGALGLLSKPFRISELAHALAKHLS
ncbi:MAG: response regulator [Phycisphaerae bacterium]|nr:response regulator [Phycisphaerae bacterium]